MMLRQLNSHIQKNEVGILPHIIYKTWLKVNKGPTCENFYASKSIKLLEEKIDINLFLVEV